MQYTGPPVVRTYMCKELTRSGRVLYVLACSLKPIIVQLHDTHPSLRHYYIDSLLFSFLRSDDVSASIIARIRSVSLRTTRSSPVLIWARNMAACARPSFQPFSVSVVVSGSPLVRPPSSQASHARLQVSFHIAHTTGRAFRAEGILTQGLRRHLFLLVFLPR